MATVREQFKARLKEEAEEQKRLEEEESRNAANKPEYIKNIYICNNCGYIIDETVPPYKPLLKDLDKCPNCGKTKKEGLFKKITKNQMLEYRRKEQIRKDREDGKEERRIEKTTHFIRTDIESQVKDLLDDLIEDIKSERITLKYFVAIFINMSFKIAEARIKRESKNGYEIDWLDYRREMFGMCDIVYGNFNIDRSAEKDYEEFDLSIFNNDNKDYNDIYNIYTKKYLGEDKYAKKEYELGKRVSETLREEEYEKELKNVERITDRELKRNEKSFKEVLGRSVNKVD